MSVSFCSLQAQKFEIQTKSVTMVDNKLVINYGFTKLKKEQLFRVWLEVHKSNGDRLNVNTVNGDIGKGITGGENKQVVWDFLADNIVIDDSVGVEIKAELIKLEQNKTSVGRALLLSSAVPGLGLVKVKQKKFYLILSAVTYGSVFASYIYNKNSYENYQKYLKENIISIESDSFSKSKSEQTLSEASMYAAITTWAINMVWTAVSASKNKRNIIDISQHSSLNINTGINPYTKTPVFTLRLNF